jgi:hypothetical protein
MQSLPEGQPPMMQNAALDSVEHEELKDKFKMLQRHYIAMQKKEQYLKQTLIQSQSKWTGFAREIVNISRELLFSTEAMGAKVTINKVSLGPISQKLNSYEAFLENNVANLRNEHGIDLTQKPTFIQQSIQQNLQFGLNPRFEMQRDSSFNDEVSPLHE